MKTLSLTTPAKGLSGPAIHRLVSNSDLIDLCPVEMSPVTITDKLIHCNIKYTDEDIVDLVDWLELVDTEIDNDYGWFEYAILLLRIRSDKEINVFREVRSISGKDYNRYADRFGESVEEVIRYEVPDSGINVRSLKMRSHGEYNYVYVNNLPTLLVLVALGYQNHYKENDPRVPIYVHEIRMRTGKTIWELTPINKEVDSRINCVGTDVVICKPLMSPISKPDQMVTYMGVDANRFSHFMTMV